MNIVHAVRAIPAEKPFCQRRPGRKCRYRSHLQAATEDMAKHGPRNCVEFTRKSRIVIENNQDRLIRWKAFHPRYERRQILRHERGQWETSRETRDEDGQGHSQDKQSADQPAQQWRSGPRCRSGLRFTRILIDQPVKEF
jgi:hypothetical protein